MTLAASSSDDEKLSTTSRNQVLEIVFKSDKWFRSIFSTFNEEAQRIEVCEAREISERSVETPEPQMSQVG
jgi:hypothetical protein